MRRVRGGGTAAWAAAALVATVAAGCGGKEQRVAELIEADAEVARAAGDGPWREASVGQWFVVGDGARTGPAGGARLRLRAAGVLRMAPSTIIRFGGGDGEPPEIALEVGESEIEVGEGGASFDLDVGLAEISGGGRVRLRAVEGGGFAFEVVVGKTIVERDGERVELHAGEALDVSFGRAVVERAAPAPRDAALPADAATGTPDKPPAGAITAVVSGRPVRSRVGEEGAFGELAIGEHSLEPGAVVRLPRGARVELSRGDERATVDGAAEIVVGEPGGELLAARRGSADILAVDVDVEIAVPGGVVIARRRPGSGSKARVEAGASSTRVSAQSGAIDVVGRAGGRETIQIGETATLTRDGRLTIQGRAPRRAVFSIDAGESPHVHDPRPPTAIRVSFADHCDGEGIVELARGRRSFARSSVISKGRGAAIVSVAAGAHRYRVRCIDDGTLRAEAAAEGTLRVLRDAGTRPLPRGAPHNNVDADGRRYTVLYQNRLPAITFRWRTAPDSDGPYRLEVRPERGQPVSVDTDEPLHTVRSGQLAEGTYEFWFEQAGGGARSKTSVLRIDFDNAAPSAHLRSPRVNARWGSDPVRIEGGALPGWRVSIGDEVLSLDRQHRFSAEARPAKGEEGLAVRFQHPRHGTRYFVRRNAER